jgi:thioredoxin-related protein
MQELASLPDSLDVSGDGINVVLFSLAGCEFCAEIREHYLKPMLASKPRGVSIAEADIEAVGSLRGWDGHPLAQSEFARRAGVRIAPTVMFFDSRGRTLAPPIVGMSRDYFGAYLDQRIETALLRSRQQRP